MASSVTDALANSLERSCDWIRQRRVPVDGVELLRAQFASGGYTRHRHDTYAIGVTDFGVQAFEYRGRIERSLRGNVVVLHPDELHDGRAGDEHGFGYHIVYVEPARIADAVSALTGKPSVLPFVPEPVVYSPTLAAAVNQAFADPPEPLALDALVMQLASGLLRAAGQQPPPRPLHHAALTRARAFLDAHHAIVRAADLEAVSGLSRYELARQFRVQYGTSPYRYSVLRRLDHAHALLHEHMALADVALSAGFADQAHFTRSFKAAFGLTPGRYVALTAR
jgi:AraC-like DNA-binding protein